MPSSTSLSEKTINTRPETGRRLMLGAIIVLAAAVIVLTGGVVLMQNEISGLKSTLLELETLKDEVTERQQEAITSTYVKSGKRRVTPGRQIKGKHVRAARFLGGSCVALTIPLCLGLHYNMTRFPNLLNHSKQEEAELEVHQFFPLVQVGCSPDMVTLLCSVYAPPCKGPRKPCRELCKRVQNGCGNLMRRFGFSWPEGLRCQRFPSSANGTQCIDTQSDFHSTPANQTSTTNSGK